MPSSDTTFADSELASELERALDRRELFAVFQPQIALRTGKVVGAEALCRWRHPRRGAVPPDVFIPLSEHTGTIHPIGQFMIDEGLEAARSWRAAGFPIGVSVNVSPLQLDSEDFASDVTERLRRFDLPAGQLTIEITESHPVGEAAAIGRLEAVRESGIRVSLDDYGAGHARSTQLSRLPLDEVKLDRSLLDGNDLEARDTILDVVDEARRRGLHIVAEGVETPEQLEFVTRIGTERAQGFLLGRPMDRVAIADLIARAG